VKILFLNHNFENFGTYFRCFYLAKYLSRKGIKVDLICASGSNFDLKIEQKEINANFRIITLPRIKFQSCPYHTGHTLRAGINSIEVLLKKYDILHSFAVAQPTTAFPTAVSKIFRNKPIIVDWDDIWGGGFGNYHPKLINIAFSFLERNIPRFSEKITVVSEFLKDKAIEYQLSKDKIRKIINGSDVEAIKPMDKRMARKRLGFGENELILLNIGHTFMDTLQGLIDVYEKVRKEKKQIKLYMVGDLGKQHKQINKKISELRDGFIFLGERPFIEIPYLLGCADILLLPMKDSLIERARFPIRFGDYLASGRPVVSNAVGEIKKIIQEEQCGLVSEPDDASGFANRIIELIDNEALSQEMGNRARKTAEEKMAWDKIADKLIDVYHEVI
jgi:glycosyltransferase involved in cell wall biosynthesis